MKIIFLEMKKIIRPLPLILCLVLLVLTSFGVLRNEVQAEQLLNTEKYPDQFTLYDHYSVDILFHDFLLAEYGNCVSTDHLDDLLHQRTEWLEQIDSAAQKDEVLLRTGTMFDKESAEFYGTVDPMGDAGSAISEQDQIYVWSCINGQMRLDGTDCPIGFLKKMDAVILTLRSGKQYEVLPSDIFPVMAKNISMIIGFVIAAWIFVIPYGVTEARSGTQTLAFTTKQGRRSYTKKMVAVSFICALIIGAGVLVVASSFSLLGADRYYGSHVTSALQNMNLTIASDDSISFAEMYGLLLGMTALLGLLGAIIITHISLQFKHAVSAIACSLPVILAFSVWCIAYIQIALDFGSIAISFSSGCLWVCICALIACVFSTGCILLKYKQNY